MNPHSYCYECLSLDRTADCIKKTPPCVECRARPLLRFHFLAALVPSHKKRRFYCAYFLVPKWCCSHCTMKAWEPSYCHGQGTGVCYVSYILPHPASVPSRFCNQLEEERPPSSSKRAPVWWSDGGDVQTVMWVLGLMAHPVVPQPVVGF